MEKKYFISVGEPWDFDSPDGQNIINGIIIKILSATCLIFKANYILDFNGISSNLFVLYPRHAESDFDDLKNGIDYVTVNGNILPMEYNENMNEDSLKENSKFVIIGSIRT
ncbi:MAG: hypothetical protein QM768_23460 [Agriterribacter sp.]